MELVRSIFAQWERGDFSSADWAHPDIEYVLADGLSPGVWIGLGRMAEHWRAELAGWKDIRLMAEEYRELDGERVLVLVHGSGHGKTSGVRMEQIQGGGANLFHILDGKVTRLVLYYDREHALADVGQSVSFRAPDELVRAAEEAFNRSEVDAFVDLVHPDVAWDAGLLGTPTYRGREGVRQMLRDVEASWEGLDVRATLLASRGPVMVVEWNMKLQGKTSGASVEGRQFVTVELRDGLAIRLRAFQTLAEAREAAGLAE